MYRNHFPTTMRSRLKRFPFKPTLTIQITPRTNYLPKMPTQNYRSNTTRFSHSPVRSYTRVSSCRTLCTAKHNLDTRIPGIEPSLHSSGRNQKPGVYNSITGDHSIRPNRVHSYEAVTSIKPRRHYRSRSETYKLEDRRVYRCESVALVRPRRDMSKSSKYKSSRKGRNVYSFDSSRTFTRPNQTYSHDSVIYSDKYAARPARASNVDKSKSSSCRLSYREDKSVSDYSDAIKSQAYLDTKSDCPSLKSLSERQVATKYTKNKRSKSMGKNPENTKCKQENKPKNKKALLTRLLEFGRSKRNTKNDLHAFLEDSEESVERCVDSMDTTNKPKCQSERLKRNESNLESDCDDYCKHMEKSSDFSSFIEEYGAKKHQKISSESSNISRQSRNLYTQKQLGKNNCNDERHSRQTDFSDQDDCSDRRSVNKARGGHRVNSEQRMDTDDEYTPPSGPSRTGRKNDNKESCRRRKMVEYLGEFLCVSRSDSEKNIKRNKEKTVTPERKMFTPVFKRERKGTKKHVNTADWKDTRFIKEPRSSFLCKSNTLRRSRESGDPKPRVKQSVEDFPNDSEMSDSLTVSNQTPTEPKSKRNRTGPTTKRTNKKHCPKQNNKELPLGRTNKKSLSERTSSELSFKRTNVGPLSKKTDRSCSLQKNNKEPLREWSNRNPKRTTEELSKKTNTKRTARSRYLRSIRQNSCSKHKPITNLRSHSHRVPAAHGYKQIVRLRF